MKNRVEAAALSQAPSTTEGMKPLSAGMAQQPVSCAGLFFGAFGVAYVVATEFGDGYMADVDLVESGDDAAHSTTAGALLEARQQALRA